MRYEFFRALSALRFKSALSAYEPTMTRSDCRGKEEVDGNPGRTATVQIRTIDGTDSERFKLLHIMRLY